MHPVAAPRQEFGLRSRANGSVPRIARSQPASPAIPVDRELFAAYVGANADRFLPTFDKMQDRDPALKRIVRSWCWPAFLLPFPWLLYRKQWAMAAAVIVIPMVLAYLFPRNGVTSLATVITVATIGKSMYVLDAAHKIRKLSGQEADPLRLRERIIQAGGVSIAGAILGAMIFVLAVGTTVLHRLGKI
jgi:Protein of unknown function (DUF2628)